MTSALAAAVAGSAWLLLAGRPLPGGKTSPGPGPRAARAGAAAGAAALPSPAATARPLAPAAPPAGGRAPLTDHGPGVAEKDDLEAALADLRRAAAAGDFDAVSRLEARLRAFVGEDAGRARLLLEAFQRETDPAALASLAAVLASLPAATGSPEIAAAMLALAEDPDAPAAAREQALAFLADAVGAPPDAFERLAALAGRAASPLREGALAALASLANASPDRQAAAVPALLRALRAEEDPDARAAFLAGVPLADAPAAAIAEVAGMLSADPAPAVRASAAHALGDASGAPRAAAVDALEAAFRTDPARETRTAALASIVRLLGGGAAPVLERMRPAAGEATPDVDDYLAILATGETQADRIWRLKFQREVARGAVPGAEEHRD